MAATDRTPLRSGLVPCGSGKRRRLSSTEASPVGNLVEDLLVEILVRLPNPRSAARCKVVCKKWRFLLSSPGFNRRFVSDHRSRNQRPPLILFSDDRQSNILSFLPMPSSTARMSFEVWDSYKDLVLCGFAGVGDSSQWYKSYFVCNPFSKQWVALPLAPQVPERCFLAAARLVCAPRISTNLDLGDDQVFVYSEYRFRVVCLYQHEEATKLHVFCSDTGEWTKELLFFPDITIEIPSNVVSCNGELFWVCGVRHPNLFMVVLPLIAAFNPFRLDIPPTVIRPPRGVDTLAWDISFSQGALHAVIFREISGPPSETASSVWRLEVDRSWRKVCEGGVVNIPSAPCPPTGLELHPGNPKVMTWWHLGSSAIASLLMCWEVWMCNLETGEEPELLGEFSLHWKMLQVEFSCWPTSIPRYEKLRVMYDGSYSCWRVQSNSTTTTPSTETRIRRRRWTRWS